MTPIDALAIDLMLGKTNGTVDNKRNVLLLRSFKGTDDYATVLRLVLAARAGHLAQETRRQADWRTRVSRRPQRSRNHDSWYIREQYARCGFTSTEARLQAWRYGESTWIATHGEWRPAKRGAAA